MNRPSLGISEISRSLNMPKGTVQGMVQTLADEGFLRQENESRKYRLGLAIHELSFVLAGSLEINQKASEPAHRLAVRSQRLIRVAILEKDAAVVTLDAYPRLEPFITRYFGSRSPLYCSAMGKAILAFMPKSEVNAYLDTYPLIPYTANTITDREELLEDLERTRLRGYAINRQEHLLSRSGIGAPIFRQKGELVGSIVMVVTLEQLDKEQRKLSRDVKETASEISRYMGHFVEASPRMYVEEDS